MKTTGTARGPAENPGGGPARRLPGRQWTPQPPPTTQRKLRARRHPTQSPAPCPGPVRAPAPGPAGSPEGADGASASSVCCECDAAAPFFFFFGFINKYVCFSSGGSLLPFKCLYSVSDSLFLADCSNFSLLQHSVFAAKIQQVFLVVCAGAVPLVVQVESKPPVCTRVQL